MDLQLVTVVQRVAADADIALRPELLGLGQAIGEGLGVWMATLRSVQSC